MLGPIFTLPYIDQEDKPIVPETLDWCKEHYTPPVKEHIHCPDFGKCDGTNGGCWWCMEMTPYQWHMCSDETWIKGLINPYGKPAGHVCLTRQEAATFIEEYKQRIHTKEPEGNNEKV